MVGNVYLAEQKVTGHTASVARVNINSHPKSEWHFRSTTVNFLHN